MTELGPVQHPYFFSGFLTEPGVAAKGMLACAAVARARYFTPGSVVAILRDPVVTSNCDRLRFESFSSCCGVHARLDLLPAALAEPPVHSGTTNVDFNTEMRAALASIVAGGSLLLSVGAGEMVVDHPGGTVTERKVPLPDPELAASAIVTGVAGKALKLSRISEALQHASRTPVAARRVVETACHSIAGLAAGSPANMHQFIELAARLAATVGVPDLPTAVLDLAGRRGSRMATTATQLVKACDGTAPDRPLAAAQALEALVSRAEQGG